jgi:hypothetical protein
MTQSWTQASCLACWDRDHPRGQPHRLVTPVAETCCFCGTTTLDGIYVRVDPSTVRFAR